jgi:plasmid stability protein
MQLLVRDLDPHLVEQLKQRARHNQRSLQGEVKAILESAAPLSMAEARRLSLEWRQRLAGQTVSDSVDLIREDRER